MNGREKSVPNLKVSIIEKVKLASGKWTNLPVKIPKSKPNGKGLYLEDSRDGTFICSGARAGSEGITRYVEH